MSKSCILEAGEPALAFKSILRFMAVARKLSKV